MTWHNFLVTSLAATGSEGHLISDQLEKAIEELVVQHADGIEAYHCAFDLEPRDTFKDYVGLMRPAMGKVWFDFDSPDGGIAAREDARKFVEWLGEPCAVYYSGSKGFHVGVAFSSFLLEPSVDLGTRLHALAVRLKGFYPTLDTTIYNANRKFRVPGSKHPKTGLYKTLLLNTDLGAPLELIKGFAKHRRDPLFFVSLEQKPNPKLVELLKPVAPIVETKPKKTKEWSAPTGKAAFEKCSFMAFAKLEPTKINEPQWYAALSIASRFQEGRKQCHEISYKHPKYSVGDCNSKIDQALSESAPRTCANISTLWDGCARCPLFGKINSPVNIFDTRFYFQGDKGLSPDYNGLLKHFQSDSAYKTIADMKTVYRFNGTHYEEYTPIEIKAFAEDSFEPKPQEKLRQEFYHKVLANFVDRRKFFTSTTEDKINFKNGVLDLTGSIQTKLRLHDPCFGFRHCLPYAYTESAGAPQFEAWIKDVMLGDEDLIRILQEFMGYVVRGGEYKYHKALWLSGSGRNGKSTFLSVLKALIGSGNYSTLSIRQIINDKFSSADLDGKIANFSEETSPEELSDSGPFKNLTGDGELLAQKKYGDPYSFRNRAKLIMTYNEVPMLKDLSPGMLSRPIIIPWKKDLTAPGSQDRNLKGKLLAELPGIFNFALRGWERLEAQGDFTTSSKSSDSLLEIESASCSATRWVQEQVYFLPNETGKTYDARGLYTAYKSWHDGGGGQAMGEMKFIKRINKHPSIRERVRHTKKGNEYFGMRIGEKNDLANIPF